MRAGQRVNVLRFRCARTVTVSFVRSVVRSFVVVLMCSFSCSLGLFDALKGVAGDVMVM